MKIDEQEKDIKNKEKFLEVEKILNKEFSTSLQIGSCHDRWRRKKELLKKLYNIDWKSPAELNPHIIFD